MKNCTQCQSGFEVTREDLIFYDKIDVPEPKKCPHCRQEQRALFRNERHFYKRQCSLTGQEMISMYPPELSTPIYHPKAWWSDNWNPVDYGREFDFDRPFFEQFAELQKVVPRVSLYGKNNENSDYTNHTDHAKNSYLSADLGFVEDVYYSKWVIYSKNIVDGYQLEKSEQCYQSQYSVGAYGSKYIYLADDSLDSDFLYNCKSVKNSLMCWNLRQKEYHIENQPYSKEAYEKTLKDYDTGSYEKLKTYKKRYAQLIQQAIRKPAELINCEECSGDYLYNCKKTYDSYGVIDSQDVRYCYDSGHLKDCYDTYESAFDGELQYQCHGCNRGKFLIGCSVCYDVNDLYYCEMSHNSEYLFGCIGLRQKKYCILNKQYSKEDYKILVPKIIEHMKKTGEWGQFLPPELSFFPYNQSSAPEFSNLSKEEVLQRGWKWNSQEKEKKVQTYQIPDHIQETPDEIVKEWLACEECGVNYRVISQELKFYRQNNLPIPRKCANCRYFERLKWRNPYRIYQRNCAQCKNPIQTTYSPNRPETVYCEECYLKEVY